MDEKTQEKDDDLPFGKNAHNRRNLNHSGKHGHYCWEWDQLYICEDCP